MRPLIHPALARVWRDPTTIQIGLDPARALVLGGLTTLDATVLRSLDGRTDTFMLRSLASEQGGDATVADRLLDALKSAGVLVDCDRLPPVDRQDAAPGSAEAPAEPPLAGQSDVRAPDRASLGILTGALDGGAAAMQARQAAWVEVRGAGRVGAQLVRLLDAAGIGRTSAVDPGPASASDVSPGGLATRHVGRPRDEAVQRLVSGTRTRSGGPGSDRSDPDAGSYADSPMPDFVVLAPRAGSAVVQGGEALVAAGIPHLAARVVELTGMVGPLVVPGRTPCLRCLELHRGDRDPAWPRIAAQAAHRGTTVAACDVTLATQVAALAAQQVLAFLDGFSPATVDGTIEVSLPYGLPRRRSWHQHPACGCAWA
ncbi:MAG TPA: ThiF family adenylyltransferase [Jiangellales bacterium]|nr:ThiF family adenylyltransferase [Jiangellales bacterium]